MLMTYEFSQRNSRQEYESTVVIVVGAAFITPAVPILPAWILCERGRDECCPYHHHRCLVFPTYHLHSPLFDDICTPCSTYSFTAGVTLVTRFPSLSLWTRIFFSHDGSNCG